MIMNADIRFVRKNRIHLRNQSVLQKLTVSYYKYLMNVFGIISCSMSDSKRYGALLFCSCYVHSFYLGSHVMWLLPMFHNAGFKNYN